LQFCIIASFFLKSQALSPGLALWKNILSPNSIIILNFVGSGHQRIVHPNNWFARFFKMNLSKEYHWSPENHYPKAIHS
jgi:hypothetical protein